MKTTHAELALVLLWPLFGACLENEEEIVIEVDGSCRVRVIARGDAADLVNGYAVPLQGGWAPSAPFADESHRWLAMIGADTGSARVQARFDSGEWIGAEGEAQPSARLSVEASFASVQEIPTTYVPGYEPYRSAYLDRTSDLQIVERGDRTVYVFERTYRPMPSPAREFWERVFEVVPEEKWSELTDYSDEELRSHAAIFSAAYIDQAEHIAREVLGAVYTEGDGSLPLEAFDRIVGRVRAGVLQHAGPEDTYRLLAWVRDLQRDGPPREEGAEVNEGEEIIRAGRRALRHNLHMGLRDEGVSREVVNAVRARLEWTFTATDFAEDLSDEKFVLSVRMPGTVIAGNYQSLEDGAARFSFEGDDLMGHPLELRAISVVE